MYEQIINQAVRARLGGMHSASPLNRSFDFAQTERLQAAGAWEQILVLATNTMHQVYDLCVPRRPST